MTQRHVKRKQLPNDVQQHPPERNVRAQSPNKRRIRHTLSYIRRIRRNIRPCAVLIARQPPEQIRPGDHLSAHLRKRRTHEHKKSSYNSSPRRNYSTTYNDDRTHPRTCRNLDSVSPRRTPSLRKTDSTTSSPSRRPPHRRRRAPSGPSPPPRRTPPWQSPRARRRQSSPPRARRHRPRSARTGNKIRALRTPTPSRPRAGTH
mmetsp:Transcript_3995/g.14522  ORF Transcript_3995/g.14522 Transcript_3995/m.14522 type:complete len:203 (+) Transcript_3995:2146-2754(+)